MRLLRIAAVFALAPLLIGVIYTYVPGFETQAEGLFKNVYFSYISYTTIGYGNLAPQAPLARILAWSEAYLSTILAALLVYALVKRSEV